jgi:hypothetical protein
MAKTYTVSVTVWTIVTVRVTGLQAKAAVVDGTSTTKLFCTAVGVGATETDTCLHLRPLHLHLRPLHFFLGVEGVGTGVSTGASTLVAARSELKTAVPLAQTENTAQISAITGVFMGICTDFAEWRPERSLKSEPCG